MRREPTVIGVSNHNGWAILVRITVRDGAPLVIDRRRVELIEPGLPNQPYEHETHDLNTAQAEQLVKEVRESAVHCAGRALAQFRSSSGTIIIAMREAVLPASPKSVAEAHASSHIMARADSMLYHEALCHAASTLGIAIELIPRGAERERAAQVLKTNFERLDEWLEGLRATLGAPWQKDHREATARAIVALAKQATLRLPDID